MGYGYTTYQTVFLKPHQNIPNPMRNNRSRTQIPSNSLPSCASHSPQCLQASVLLGAVNLYMFVQYQVVHINMLHFITWFKNKTLLARPTDLILSAREEELASDNDRDFLFNEIKNDFLIINPIQTHYKLNLTTTHLHQPIQNRLEWFDMLWQLQKQA